MADGNGKQAVELTDANFDSVVKGSQPSLVDFWAEWCGPCKQVAPHLEELSDEMSDRIDVVKMNVDENPRTPGSLQVRGIPTLMVFKDGELVAQRVGAMPKSALKQWLDSVV